MTAQAMTLSLEQQTQQRHHQAQPQARAPGAASPSSPPAVAPKPKKPLAPRGEPEQELKSVGACLRGGAEAGQVAGLRGQETPQGWGGGGGRCWERGDLAGGAAPSLPLPAHRRPHRRPERSPSGPGASSRNRTISRRWVRVLGVAGLSRSPLGTPRRVIGSPGALTGQQQIKVKTVKPPPKVQIPQEPEQEEEQEQEEEPRAGGGDTGGGGALALWVCAGSHMFPLLPVSAIPPTSPHSEEATDTRWSQRGTRG